MAFRRGGAAPKSDVFRPAEVVSCHAFNADKTKVAVCPNDHRIIIYRKNGDQWEQEAVLEEHTQIVTGIDWGKVTNRIVTCSQDRNAYVWTLEGSEWKPMLVILRLNRCATHVAWSPNEDKFAVATGAKMVCVCYFEEDNDWWVSKHVRKDKKKGSMHRSTVTSVQWHPNNVLLATTSTDYKARVWSAWTKGVDKRGLEALGFEKKELHTFGSCLAEYDCSAWVQHCAWSPSGNLLGFVGQDSSLNVADVASGEVQNLKLNQLPMSKLVFVGEDKIVGAGFDCEPFLFQGAGTNWSFVKSLDAKEAKEKKGGSVAKMWQNMDTKGSKDDSAALKTKHQNTITCVSQVGPNEVATSGLDGQFFFWKL